MKTQICAAEVELRHLPCCVLLFCRTESSHEVGFVVKETSRLTEEDESVNSNVCCVVSVRWRTIHCECVNVCVWEDVKCINNTLYNNMFVPVV